MTEITAQLNYLRISPRKVRAVAKILKGLEVDQAEFQLKHIAKRSAKPLLKLLNSAVANAKNNHNLDKNYLYIKDLIVNEGVKLKRFKPKGFGMVMPIQKKTSHIKIILDELPEERKKQKEKITAEFNQVSKEAERVEGDKKSGTKKEEKKSAKPSIKKELETKPKKQIFSGIKRLGRKMFRRKSV